MDELISRRRAARVVGLTALAAFVPAARLLGASQSLLLRPIPKTGEKIPLIGLGSAVSFDVPSRSPQAQQVEKVISLFARHGGKLIDTSPAYGNAESLIGEFGYKLGLRDSLFFATKVWTRSVEEGVAQMERSLQRLRRRTIDLIQVHNLANLDREMNSLREWKAKGKLRYTGITYSEDRGHGEVERAMRLQKPDFVQINYSLMERAADRRILPLASDMGMGVIINRPFGGGGIFQVISSKPLPQWAGEFDCRSWAQFLLKWIVSHPAVTCAIPATNNPEHLVDNMGACVGRLPDAKMRARMASLFVGF